MTEYTDDQKLTLNKLEAFIQEQPSQKQASRILGMSDTVISKLRKGTYEGNADEKLDRISRYLEMKEDLKNTYSPSKYVDTYISSQIYDIIKVCHTKGGLSIVSGEAGIGKTKAIKKYVIDHPTNSFVITMNPCLTGVKTLLSIIADEIGSEHPYSIPKLYTAIRNRLSDGMVLIFDEAQHMTLKNIEILRSFSDYFDNMNQTLGICFIGNPETVYRMGVKKAEFAQIANRAKQIKVYSTSEIQRSDIEKLFPILADKNMNAEIDFLYHIAQTPQALRGAVNLFSNAYDHENITYEGLVAMAKFMEMEV